jgi:hypothetical protein
MKAILVQSKRGQESKWEISGIIRFNNDGRARHSVRAAGWQPTRSAGSGLPALPAFSSWFVIWIIPKIPQKNV